MARDVDIRAEEEAEFGSTAELQRLEAEGAAPRPPSPTPGREAPAPALVEGEEEFSEEGLDFGFGEEDDDGLEPEGEIEALLFGDPPEGEIETAGMPTGPGPNTVRLPRMDDEQYMGHVARVLAGSNDPDAQALGRRIGRERLGLLPDEEI
jgi:hypothetical protein